MAEPDSSRIIKASALIPDTKALLAAWDLERSTSTNLQRVRLENALGKTSRKRVSDMLTILRFCNPVVFQIIDRHAYRALYGEDCPL